MSSPQTHSTLRRLALPALAALGSLLTASPAWAGPFGLPDMVTPWGEQITGIWTLLVVISLGILIVVEGGLLFAILKFRKKKNETRQPATWSHNTTLEIIWTAIPFALLIVVLVPTFKALSYLADVPAKPDYTLEVVGHQFFWEYRYPDLGVKYVTSPSLGAGTGMEELYVPTDKEMKVVLTSSDVIHSWWVPAFGIQQMTTPGMLAQMPLKVTKPGLYEGACSYLCGSLHGAMRIKVKAVPEAEFLTWAAAHKGAFEPLNKVGKIGMTKQRSHEEEHAPAPGATEGKAAPAEEHGAAPAAAPAVDAAALKAQGGDVFASKCAGCHQTTGLGLPGMFPPLAGAEQVTGDEKAFAAILVKGLNGAVSVKGQSYNGMMPSFASLSDEEIAAVGTYVRQSFGNAATPLTPETVKAVR